MKAQPPTYRWRLKMNENIFWIVANRCPLRIYIYLLSCLNPLISVQLSYADPCIHALARLSCSTALIILILLSKMMMQWHFRSTRKFPPSFYLALYSAYTHSLPFLPFNYLLFLTLDSLHMVVSSSDPHLAA